MMIPCEYSVSSFGGSQHKPVAQGYVRAWTISSHYDGHIIPCAIIEDKYTGNVSSLELNEGTHLCLHPLPSRLKDALEEEYA